MLQVLVDYLVPLNLFVLMLIAGTEISLADFRALSRNPLPALIGATGQLLFLPLIALCIVNSVLLHPTVATGTLILALRPGGGISNTYCFLGRCNVLLSAIIAAIGTLLSLATIPLWLSVLPAVPGVEEQLKVVPSMSIIAQLLAFMVMPLAAGILVRAQKPQLVERHGSTMRALSSMLILVILIAALWSVRHQLAGLTWDITIAATLFIVTAMLLGHLLGYRMGAYDRPVLVIESGVRNVGVALILGGAMLSKPAFGVFASFLMGYFIVEIIIMVSYAKWLSFSRPKAATATARL